MSALLYLIGLIIGATVFIYLYSTYQSGKEKLKEYKEKKDPPEAPEPSVNPEVVDFFSIKRAPGARLCPLCGSQLAQYEVLYASEVTENEKKKILIHGCRYCYKEEKGIEARK